MPALMLTKARWNKKSLAPQYQHPISSQHSLPSRISSRTFQEPLVSLQRGLLSSASPGHLWVCPGPPQHRMALCHPLVAYRGWQALLWLRGGHIQDPWCRSGRGVPSASSFFPHPCFGLLLPGIRGGCPPPEGSQLSCPMSHESPRQFQVQGRASLNIPAHPTLPASHGKCLRVIQIGLL